MCGLAGFSGPRDQRVLAAMARRLQHRGPDGAGFHVCPVNPVSLAHQRLAVTDIAGGLQPMWNEDKSICVIFNGEIYNHPELRVELAKLGHRFESSHSDTEVLVHGYEAWGDELPEHLNGMFAFCVYDRPRRRLFWARDRFGKKPLYYTRFGDQLVFASELKALMEHPGVCLAIDPLALKKYFGYGFIPAPYSLYRGILKLPGGHRMSFDLGTHRLEVSRFWEFRVRKDPLLARQPEDVLAEELRSRLTAAVRRRLVADVPVGVFLSGGIDSATVLACATAIRGEGQVRSFSIGFSEREFDESVLASEVAQHFHSIHASEMLGIESAREVAGQVLGMLDEPMGDSSILPTFLLSRFARKSVTVALGGDGGDELLAGYAPFRALAAARAYCKFLPPALRRYIKGQVDRLPVSENYLSPDFKLKRTLQGLQHSQSIWNPAWLAPLEAAEIAELMNAPADVEEIYGDAIMAWEQSDAEDMVGRSIEFYGRFYLQDSVLAKVDRASMMVGLEVRTPFLDNAVVDFLSAMPTGYKLRGGMSKVLLKRAMRGILADPVLKRPKKGFGIPLTSWLKSWPQPDTMVPDCAPEFPARMLSEHRAGKRDNRLFLWCWMVLQRHLEACSGIRLLSGHAGGAFATSSVPDQPIVVGNQARRAAHGPH
jgi:asparagine synthase (glutamine-hydrolysing)